jgi:hypothetical protein
LGFRGWHPSEAACVSEQAVASGGSFCGPSASAKATAFSPPSYMQKMNE